MSTQYAGQLKGEKTDTRGPLLTFVMICGFAAMCFGQRSTTLNAVRETSTVSEVSYYYKNYHCFDFVKQCELEIVKLTGKDTLIYVKSSQFHGEYEEIHGKLTSINDSIYYVQPFRHIVQSGNDSKPFRFMKDTVIFYCDSAQIGCDITLEYMNGFKEEHKISGLENRFRVNEAYFNEENKRLYLSFGYKNPIVDETVEIVSKYSDIKYSVSFRSRQRSDDFYIVLDDKHIKTLNIVNGGHQCSGPMFNLDKLSKDKSLPRDRKLYDSH